MVIIIQQFVSSSFFLAPNKIEGLIFQSDIQKRLPSIYTWIGDYSALGLAFMPILALITSRHIINDNKYYYVFYIFMGAIVAFLSRSRFIILNWGLILLMLAHYNKFSKEIIIRTGTILIFTIIIISFILPNFGLQSNRIIEERLLQKQYGGIMEGTASTRILAFKVFAQVFPKRPFFGNGLSQDQGNLHELLAGKEVKRLSQE